MFQISLNKNLIKNLALILSCAIMHQSVGMPLAQASMLKVLQAPPPNISLINETNLYHQSDDLTEAAPKFKISSSLGEVVDVYAPKTAGRMIYHIQDVHEHEGAQTNLSGIISALENYAHAKGKKLLVAVEGATEIIDTDTISSLPNTHRKTGVIDALLTSGFFLGEDHAAVKQKAGRIKITGVETPDLYRLNVDAKFKSAVSRSAVLPVLNETRGQLEKLKEHNFNTVINQIEKNRLAVEEGTLGVVDHVKYLSAIDASAVEAIPSLAHVMELSRLESNLDFDLIESETKDALSALTTSLSTAEMESLVADSDALKSGELSPLAYYRKIIRMSHGDTAQLADYIAYLEMSDRINPDDLFEGIEQAEMVLARKLIKHPLAKDLYRHVRWIERQEKFLSLSLIPQEWNKQKTETENSFKEHYAAIQDFINEQKLDLGYQFVTPNPPAAQLKEAFYGASSFYRAAQERDGAMVANLKKLLTINIKDDYEVAFIAGGFHTDGLKNNLKNYGMAFSVIRPNLETKIQLSHEYQFAGINKVARFLDKYNKNTLRLTNAFKQPGGAMAAEAFISAKLPQLTISKSSSPKKHLSARIREFIDRHFLRRSYADPFLLVTIVVMGLGLLLGMVVAYEMLMDVEWIKIKLHKYLGLEFDYEIENFINAEDIANAQAMVKSGKINVYDAVYVLGLKNQVINDEEGDPLRLPLSIINPDNVLKKTDDGLIPVGFEPAIYQGNALPNSYIPETPNSHVLDFETTLGKNASVGQRPVMDRNDAIAQHTTLIINFMFGGLEEKNGEINKLATAMLVPNVSIPSIDSENRGHRIKVSVSNAELKLLQVIEKARQNDFQKIVFEATVNNESSVSLNALLDSVYLLDKYDSSLENKRTYRAVMENEFHIEIKPFIIQAKVPYIEEGEKFPQEFDDSLARVGGHGQIGNRLLFDILEWARNNENKSDIDQVVRLFANGEDAGDNINSQMAGYILNKRIPILMMTTAATRIDVKGGKIVYRFVHWLGRVFKIPALMELGEAKSVGQMGPFIEAGQESGFGRSGGQDFNTNSSMPNQNLLGPILIDLEKLVIKRLNSKFIGRRFKPGDFEVLLELAKIWSPNRVRRKKNVNDKIYDVFDGAIGSVFVNLAAFFKVDPYANKILKKHGVDGDLVEFMRVPRRFFRPVQFPSDQWFYAHTSRFRVESKGPQAWTFVDFFPEQSLPPLSFIGHLGSDYEATGNWLKDAGPWAAPQTISDNLDQANTNQLESLEVVGEVFSAPHATFVGQVKITNHLKDADLKEIFKTETSNKINFLDGDGNLRFENIDLVIHENGTWSAEQKEKNYDSREHPISGIKIVYFAIYLTVLDLVLRFTPNTLYDLGPWVWILAQILAFLGALGWYYSESNFSTAEVPLAVLGHQGNSSDESAELYLNPGYDSKLVSYVHNYIGNVNSEILRAAPIQTVVARGRTWAASDLSALKLIIGKGFIEESRFQLVARLKLVLIHLGLSHETAHFAQLNAKNPNGRNPFVEEFLAWVYTPYYFFKTIGFGANPKNDSDDQSHAAESVAREAAAAGDVTDKITNGLADLKKNKIGQAIVSPSFIVIPVDDILSGANPAITELQNVLLMVQQLIKHRLGDHESIEKIKSTVVLTTSRSDTKKLIDDMLKQTILPGIQFTPLLSAENEKWDLARIFTEAKVSVPKNSSSSQFLFVPAEKSGAYSSVDEKQLVAYHGRPQLGLALFAYTNYSAGKDALNYLIRIFSAMPQMNNASVTNEILMALTAAINA